MHQKRLKEFLKYAGSKEQAAKLLGIRKRRWNQMVQMDNATKTVRKLIDCLIEHTIFEDPPEVK